MTSKAIVKASELKRMADIANAENVTVELERDGTIYRVMPFVPSERQKLSREEEAEAELARWVENREREKELNKRVAAT